jgi:hypothetical protein
MMLASLNTLDTSSTTEVSNVRALKKSINDKITSLLSNSSETISASEMSSLQSQVKVISDNNVNIASVDDLIVATGEKIPAGAMTRKENWQKQRLEGLAIDNSYFSGEVPMIGALWDTVSIQCDGQEVYPWVFSKTLTHNSKNMASKADLDQLLDYFQAPTLAKLKVLPQHANSVRSLEDPTGGLGFEPQGRDTFTNVISKSVANGGEFIPSRSAEGAAEMMEVYAHMVLRDMDVNATSHTVKDAAMSNLQATGSDVTKQRVMNALNAVGAAVAATGKSVNYPYPVNAQNLFRGAGAGEQVGPYISQFLLRNIGFGNATFEQKYQPEADHVKSITPNGFLAMQNGVTGGGIVAQGSARHLTTFRDVGSLVHNDPAFGLYFNAALIAGKTGRNGFDASATRGSNFLDTGGPDYLTTIASVTRGALRAAWGTKWQMALKVRPEVYAARYQWMKDQARSDTGMVAVGFDDLLGNGYSAAAGLSSVNAPGASGDLLQIVDAQNKSKIADRIAAINALASPTAEETAEKAELEALANTTNLFLNGLYREGSPTHPAFPAGHATVAGACVTVMKAFLKTHDKDTFVATKFESVYGADSATVGSASGQVMYDGADKSDMTVQGELNKLASNVALGRDIAGVHYRCDGDCGLKMGEKYAISFLHSLAKSYYPDILTPICFLVQRFDNSFVRITENGVTEL